MLYDPKWEPDRKLEGVSLRALIYWLETQDPATEYNFLDPEFCVLGQFRASQGMIGHRRAISVLGDNWLADVAQGYRGGDQERTFGAALRRAKAALSANQTGGK